jgi:hypothetical protein
MSILFILFVVRRPTVQKVLILFPLVFLICDFIENILFLYVIQAYPFITSGFVKLASTITVIKRFNQFISYMELFGSLLVTLFILMRNLVIRKTTGPANVVNK